MALYVDNSTIFNNSDFPNCNFNGKFTGIPRTVYNLSKHINKLYPRVKFCVFNDKTCKFYLINFEDNKLITDVTFHKDDVIFTAGATWSFANYNNVILDLKKIGVKYFQCFYDLIPTKFPYFYEKGKGFGSYFESWCKQSFSLCNGAYAISQCSKNDMVKIFDLQKKEAEKIKVIKLGMSFVDEYDEEFYKKKYAKFEKFVLSVGTIEIRKNQILLLNAYRNLVKKNIKNLPQLIIVGSQGWNCGGINYQLKSDPLIKEIVTLEETINDYELDWLYKNCSFSLFPSFYEGLGLPVVESLSAGRPCITSNVSSMKEIDNQYLTFLSPYDLDAWTNQILYLIENIDILESKANQIKNGFKPTTWQSTSKEVLNYLKMD